MKQKSSKHTYICESFRWPSKQNKQMSSELLNVFSASKVKFDHTPQ